jgi:hypothetical protein
MFERNDAIVEDMLETALHLPVQHGSPPTRSDQATEVPRPYKSQLGRKCDWLAEMVLCCLGRAAHKTWRAHAGHVLQQ